MDAAATGQSTARALKGTPGANCRSTNVLASQNGRESRATSRKWSSPGFVDS
jgi:hypothetical protein